MNFFKSIPELSPQEVKARLGQIRIIDVRGLDEYHGELGHIQGAELVTLGAKLTQTLQEGDRTQEIVFVCKSGGRSGRATAESLQLGYEKTSNMIGGMLLWNELGLPRE